MRVNRYAIIVIRERSGLSKAELARRVPIHRAHMGDIESGRRQPSAEIALRIAQVLKVPIAAIVGDPDGDETVERDEAQALATDEEPDGPGPAAPRRRRGGAPATGKAAAA